MTETTTISNERRHAEGKYYGREPMAPVAMSVGQRVRFECDRRWWAVRGATAETVVLTRKATFAAVSAWVYTVVDWRAGVRGPVNVIGQGWDVDTDEKCQELAELVRGGTWEISWRNWVPVAVVEVR